MRAFPTSPLASGSDGISVELDEVTAEGVLVISGVIWSLAPSRSHPLWARLQLGRERIDAYEVRLGDEPERTWPPEM